MDKNNKILTNGGFRVIPLLEELHGLRFDAIEAFEDITYAAISYFWSDGLENPKTNSLPLCQLRDLKSEAVDRRGSPNKVDDGHTVYIWTDTLACL